jgi:nucleoside diphosphate kinase
MASELAYAIITPYTIRKSRTGAVLARLLNRTSSKLIGAQMIAPTKQLAEDFATNLRSSPDPQEEHYRSLLRTYVRENFTPSPGDIRHRVLLLVFAGENAREDLALVAGNLRSSDQTGETLRDTFGDLLLNPDGSVRYFEPAVIISDYRQPVDTDLQIWLDFIKDASPLLDKICTYSAPELVEKTLVLIKPDSWQQRSFRPGAIIDMFSRTGLRLIGCKLINISIAQALEFYGPVCDVLCTKLAPGIAVKAKKILEEQLDFELSDEAAAKLQDAVGVPYARDQFERIIKFMSGLRPSDRPKEDWELPGPASVLALVYEGENAVNKIREVLGPTDPTKAPCGTVRHDFGSNVMINTAHASDSPENAQREMGILKLHQGNLRDAVEEFRRNRS